MSETVLEPPQDERLTDALKRLLTVARGGSLKVGEVVEILQGRGMHTIILLLCLPFLSPVAIPGLSLPFGVAIVVCGCRVAFGHKPWLPKFILRRELSNAILTRMVRLGCGVYRWVEKIVRPRWGFLFDAPGMRESIGLTIALAGFLLSLPIPPPFPFTNTIPGFALIFFALGFIERDGILLLLGYLLTILATAYFVLIAVAGMAGINHVLRWFSGGN